MLVETARLAGVPRILNEPSNLWWGGSGPTVQGVHGMILPSAAAAHFWKQRVEDISSNYSAPMLRYYVINPGIVLPEELDGDPSEVFSAPKQLNLSSLQQPDKGQDVRAAVAVVVVGWAGRMEKQKSPGLAVHLAALLKAVFMHRPQTKSCVLMAGGGTLLGYEVANGSASIGGTLGSMARQIGLQVGKCPSLGADESLRKGVSQGAPSLGASWADIEFTGPLSHIQLLALLVRRVDVLVHTNVLEETFCMVNVESMARGVPIVSFGVGGVSEYLHLPPDGGEDEKKIGKSSNNGVETRNDRNEDEDARGIVVRPVTLGSLCGAVSRLIDDGVERRAMGVAARRFTLGTSASRCITGKRTCSLAEAMGVSRDKSFGNDRMARQYAVLYASLFAEANSDHPAAMTLPPRRAFEDSLAKEQVQKEKLMKTDSKDAPPAPSSSDRVAFMHRMERLAKEAGGALDEKVGRVNAVYLLSLAAATAGCPLDKERVREDQTHQDSSENGRFGDKTSEDAASMARASAMSKLRCALVEAEKFMKSSHPCMVEVASTMLDAGSTRTVASLSLREGCRMLPAGVQEGMGMAQAAVCHLAQAAAVPASSSPAFAPISILPTEAYAAIILQFTAGALLASAAEELGVGSMSSLKGLGGLEGHKKAAVSSDASPRLTAAWVFRLAGRLCEVAVALSPRAQNAYRIAAHARSVTGSGTGPILPPNTAAAAIVAAASSDSSEQRGGLLTENWSEADGWDLAAEWHRRAAVLMHNSGSLDGAAAFDLSCVREKTKAGEACYDSLGAFVWLPPPAPEEVHLDLVSDDYHVRLAFRTTAPQPPSAILSSICAKGAAVWARWPADAQYYRTIEWTRPWFRAIVLDHRTSSSVLSLRLQFIDLHEDATVELQQQNIIDTNDNTHGAVPCVGETLRPRSSPEAPFHDGMAKILSFCAMATGLEPGSDGGACPRVVSDRVARLRQRALRDSTFECPVYWDTSGHGGAWKQDGASTSDEISER